jgi:hypothetical protein
MKFQSDKNRSEREFQVGDWVYLKLQPYIQKSIATRANPKLAFKYYGPFLVLRRIGLVAYELQLPETSTVHPVFHVSQLKYAVGQQQAVDPLPSNPEAPILPVEILSKRQVKRGAHLISQVQVRWSGLDAGMSTWENEEELRFKFPEAPAWGQAAFEGGRNVTDRRTRKWRQRREYALQKKLAAAGAEAEDQPEDKRPKRRVKPNPKYAGDAWTK